MGCDVKGVCVSEEPEMRDVTEEVQVPKPIDDVWVGIEVVLGETTMAIHELLRLGRGAVIALDTTEEDDVSIKVGATEIAGGQLRLNGEQVEVMITETRLRGEAYRVPSDRFRKMAEEAA